MNASRNSLPVCGRRGSHAVRVLEVEDDVVAVDELVAEQGLVNVVGFDHGGFPDVLGYVRELRVGSRIAAAQPGPNGLPAPADDRFSSIPTGEPDPGRPEF